MLSTLSTAPPPTIKNNYDKIQFMINWVLLVGVFCSPNNYVFCLDKGNTLDMSLITRAVAIILQVPCLRYGKFSTGLFERYQGGEQALVLAMQGMAVYGVSTRKVRLILEKLYGENFWKFTISSIY